MTEAEYRRVWRIRRKLEKGRGGRKGGRERRNSENGAKGRL
jgi:hypothetical protein